MDEQKIVEKFFERNEEAIMDLKRLYNTYCLYIAENILYDKEEAEECLNDALLAAWNSIPPNKPKNLKTYLGKLIREIAIDKWRKSNAKKRNTIGTLHSFDELEEMVGESTVEETVEDAELAHCISIFLRTLREKERNVFVRRYWYCDSIENICVRYGFSKGKVVMMLSRTRQKLAEHLKKEGLMK